MFDDGRLMFLIICHVNTTVILVITVSGAVLNYGRRPLVSFYPFSMHIISCPQKEREDTKREANSEKET